MSYFKINVTAILFTQSFCTEVLCRGLFLEISTKPLYCQSNKFNMFVKASLFSFPEKNQDVKLIQSR